MGEMTHADGTEVSRDDLPGVAHTELTGERVDVGREWGGGYRIKTGSKVVTVDRLNIAGAPAAIDAPAMLEFGGTASKRVIVTELQNGDECAFIEMGEGRANG